MAHIIFYEKPGCVGNARQKALLKEAGHELDIRDILTINWSEARLMKFLALLPVPEWFNSSAPAVKEGLVQPALLDKHEALELLLAQPLLIRRPLIEALGKTWVGFEEAQLTALLPNLEEDDYEACPRDAKPCAT